MKRRSTFISAKKTEDYMIWSLGRAIAFWAQGVYMTAGPKR